MKPTITTKLFDIPVMDIIKALNIKILKTEGIDFVEYNNLDDTLLIQVSDAEENNEV